MICPLCIDTTLQPMVRDGIEIDVCPRCHGMWLDRGELSRLMAADPISTLAAPIPADQYDPTAFGDEGRPPPPPVDDVDDDDDDDEDDDRHDDDQRRWRDEKHRKKHKKKNKRRGKKSKKHKPKSWSRRLGDIIEDVIDELD